MRKDAPPVPSQGALEEFTAWLSGARVGVFQKQGIYHNLPIFTLESSQFLFLRDHPNVTYTPLQHTPHRPQCPGQDLRYLEHGTRALPQVSDSCAS